MTLRLVSLSCLVLLVALSADRGHAAMVDDDAESSVRTRAAAGGVSLVRQPVRRG